MSAEIALNAESNFLTFEKAEFKRTDYFVKISDDDTYIYHRILHRYSIMHMCVIACYLALATVFNSILVML